MAIAGIPNNFVLQQANAEAFLSWDIASGATSYSVQRSTDGVTFSVLDTPTTTSYLDDTVIVGTQYWFKVASVNADGTSSYTSAQSCVPTNTGVVSLGQIRLMAKQRADRVNSNFVTMAEWNSYINQSYFELYDLLVTTYEDFFLADPYQATTDGTSSLTLPTDFYKLMGVDLGLASSNNGFVTLKKFEFISRNRYVFPNVSSTYMGVFNMRYRLMGNTLKFIPTPAAGQPLQIWYIPRMTELLQDTDMLDGVSGWTEYVIVDAAMKALQKEESDVSVLMAEKQMLIKRIEETAMNRDAGQPDTISNTRLSSERWGGYDGGPGFDGSFGGF